MEESFNFILKSTFPNFIKQDIKSVFPQVLFYSSLKQAFLKKYEGWGQGNAFFNTNILKSGNPFFNINHCLDVLIITFYFLSCPYFLVHTHKPVIQNWKR